MSKHYPGKLVWKLDNGSHPENRWSVDQEDDHNATWIGISTESGRTVALVVNDDDRRPLASHEVELDENARRLVACWNVCDGVDTEVLEINTQGGGVLNLERQRDAARHDCDTWEQRACKEATRAVELEQQRDALLADLQLASETLRRYETLHRAKNTEESTAKAEVNAVLASRFEATIAAAKAGAQ